MERAKKIGLFLMGLKGYSVLKAVTDDRSYLDEIHFVVGARDKAVANDYYEDIKHLSELKGIRFFEKGSTLDTQSVDWIIAISWRWLINDHHNKLIVFHDSLLPKYRGFNPLVTSLINGDNEIGVTAIIANAAFDAGNIVGQESAAISYPINIKTAIEIIATLYESLAIKILDQIRSEQLKETIQAENDISYSLWRNEDDYFINWNDDAAAIRRFVDAVGFPYLGAKTTIEGKILRIREVATICDLPVINRTPGKVFFFKEGNPVVVCGKGMLEICHAELDGQTEKYIFKKLRIRFR